MLHARPTFWGIGSHEKSFARPVTCARVVSWPVPVRRNSVMKPRRSLVVKFRNGVDASAHTAEKEPAEATGTTGPLVPVVFELCKHCPFGHTFALVGDAPQLGEWDVSRALKLEWSEGDVWTGQVELEVDSPVAFKYIQIDGNGKLVYWGQDVGGGSNISLIVSPSVEDTSGLQITMDPADAADTSRQPWLAVRLDSSALLPESTTRQAAEDAQTAAGNGQTLSDDVSIDSAPSAALGQVCAEPPGPAEADAVMAADEVEMQPLGGLGDEPSAEYDSSFFDSSFGSSFDSYDESSPLASAAATAADVSGGPDAQMLLREQQQEAGEGETGPVTNLDQLQLQDESESDTEGQVVEDVVQAGPETTSESVQEQGLQADTQDSRVGGAQAAAREAVGAPLDPVAAGGVAAGFEDAGSVGAAVAGGLMEAGDDETAAGFTGPADGPTPAPSLGSNGSGSVSSYMLTSMDLEDSETDESSLPDTTSFVDSTPRELDRGQLMAATAQESARLADTHTADAAKGTAASTAADGSRSALEGLPTPGDSNAAAVGEKMLGAQILPVEGVQDCRPPNPNSKIVTAGPSITSLDLDTPLQDPEKLTITEIDSSSKGVQPVDSYETTLSQDSLGALTALAAAAAASYDGGHHDREGAAAAAEERKLQLVRADGEGTGTWTGGSAAGDGGAMGSTARSTVNDAGVGSAVVDGERTGTWTGEAAAAAAADSSSGGEGAQRATEQGQKAVLQDLGGRESPSSNTEGQASKKPRNWLQRLFGGGGQDEDRA